MENNYERDVFIVIVIIWISYFHETDGQCNTTKNGEYRFGPGCDYMCHCLNNAPCNVDTGACPDGCDFDWVGPGCQYKNSAVNQSVKHVDNMDPPRTADRANDRNLLTCSYTGSPTTNRNMTPWWKVWFPFNFTMWQMEILTINSHTGYFNDFIVKVESVPAPEKNNRNYYPAQTQICYKHNNSEPLNVSMTVICETAYVGNQVRIQLAKRQAQLVLCNVKIFGGRNIAFGRRALQSSVKNNNQNSTVAATKSVDGELQPWEPKTCSITKNENNQWWMVDLNHIYNIAFVNIWRCRQLKLNDYKLFASNNSVDWKLVYDKPDSNLSVTRIGVNFVSRHINISSINGLLAIAEVQIFGDCLENECGYDCSKVCHCKKITAEDKMSGICTNGCKGRWSGRDGTCDKECADNHWGEMCHSQCGHCRNSEPCDVVTGHCLSTCEDGYKSIPFCVSKCDNGSYGISCSRTCSTNCKDICNKQSGDCEFCKNGWHGANCTIECVDRKRGENCERICFTCHNRTCDRFSGTCTRQCKPGFKQTKYCDQECSSGWYGINCSKECSPNCKDVAFCRKTDGECSECKPGLEGVKCEKAAGTNEQFTGGEVAGILVTFVVLILISVIVTVLVTRRRLQAHRSQNTYENETMSYSNVLAAELNQAEVTGTVYDTLKRKSGIEHTYE